jgi:hypothetical protein
VLANIVPKPADDDDHAGSWLTLSEAAERSGLHKEALRARAKRGQLQARKNNRGETLVMVPPELLTAAQGDGQGAAQGQTEQLTDLVRELEGELAEAQVKIARLEERIEAARAVAIADVATAKAEVEAKERYVRQLEELLAAANRPWWRKLLG